MAIEPNQSVTSTTGEDGVAFRLERDGELHEDVRPLRGRREIPTLDGEVPTLKAGTLREHQLRRGMVSRALLEAALEAIPAATFIIGGSSIEHANARGRILLDRERTATVYSLRESMRTRSPDAPFALTSVERPGLLPTALAVLRGGRPGSGEIGLSLAAFSARHALTPRQGEVLALLARGCANKTIAHRLGLAEGTVEEHVTLLLHKAGVDSRAALIAKFWTE